MTERHRKAKKKALEHLRRGEYDEALPIVEQLYEADPDDPGLRLWLARSLRSVDDTKRVVDLLRPLLSKGVALRSQRVLEDALLNTYAGEQYLDAAERLLAVGNTRDAELAVARAAKTSPRNERVRQRCRQLRKQLRRRR